MDRKLTGLISIFFLTFFIFISLIVFNKPIAQFTRAKEDSEPSSVNSAIFAYPLTVKADGRQQADVNVFVRSSSNKPVPNREVSLSTSLGSVQTTGSTTTDQAGHVSFKLTSSQAGVAELSAIIDNSVPLSQKVTVKFE